MPAQKKVWVFDGSIAQYPNSFLSTVHGLVDCTTCHGGNNLASTRTEAHDSTWQANPGADKCQGCHPTIAQTTANGLHVNLGGYVKVLGDRGFDFTEGTVSKARFDQQCTKCHVANAETKPACGFCHVSVPVTAGGGLLDGHNFRKTPDMDRNCTACHGSRVKDEFYGNNGPLTARNGLGYAAPLPDVHFAQTQELNADGYKKGCTFCHSEAEMHGQGAPAPTGSGDRYAVTSAPTCEGCHQNLVGANTLHSAGHMATLACQSCHSQPYKNCFGCHTDVDTTDTGLPFYRINEGDPTLAERSAVDASATPDALMAFRIGKNPKWAGTGDTAHKKYGLLRHVPVDKDVFKYPSSDPVDGLIPNMAAQPTWKYATPHNIQLNPHSFSCNSCHDATGYAENWLTDPLQNAQGWLQDAYKADEQAANTGVIMTAPPQMDAQP